jgi:hypothetical protein
VNVGDDIKQLQLRIVESAKVLLDFNYQLGVDTKLMHRAESIQQSDDPLVVFDEIADDDPEEAIYLLMSCVEILFHGYRMHSAKQELSALRKTYGELN